MDANADKIELIQKLLKKAESTTPAEAEALTEHAERLMLKYSIDEALLNARSTGDKERIEVVKIELDGIYAKAYMDMFFSIAMAYGEVNAFYTQWDKNRITFTVVGFESTVSQLKLLLTSLQLQVVSALTAWASNGGIVPGMKAMEKYKERRTFIKAFGQGVATRLYRSRASAVKEAEKSTPGAELVLRDRKSAVDDFMRERFGKMRSVKSREKRGGHGASLAGYAAGKNANTGERQVNPGRRAIEA